MEDRSPAMHPDSAAGGTRTEIDAQRERLRADLLAAAEQEAAAIVEQARQEITVTVRRAHRDLLLIRAQLRLCGLEPRSIGTGLDASHLLQDIAAHAVDPEPSRDVRSTPLPALEHFATESVADAPNPPAADSSERDAADTEVDENATAFVSPRSKTRTLVLVPVIVVAIAAGAVAIWRYPQREQTASGASVADADHDGARVASSGRGSSGAADAGARDTPHSTPRVRLQTTRPVWLRLDVDGNGDVGQLYAAGVTKDFNPAESLRIRAGDAGAVLVSVDGAPLQPMGAVGQVLTRRIVTGKAAMAAGADPVAVAPPAPAPVSPPTASAPVVTVPLERRPEGVAAERVASDVPPPPSITATRPPLSAPPLSAPPVGTNPDSQAAIFAGHSQWVEAYATGDQRTLAGITMEGFSLRDERARSSGNRTVITPDQVSEIRVDVAGVGAVLTARLRQPVDGVMTDALLSEVWVRRDQNRWGLMGVRITPVASVPRSVR